MTGFYDTRESRDPAEREAELFSRLPDVLRRALAAPAYAERLKGVDPAHIKSRAALSTLPLLRKSELPALHKAAAPFGGFIASPPGSKIGPGEVKSRPRQHRSAIRTDRGLFAGRLLRHARFFENPAR